MTAASCIAAMSSSVAQITPQVALAPRENVWACVRFEVAADLPVEQLVHAQARVPFQGCVSRHPRQCLRELLLARGADVDALERALDCEHLTPVTLREARQPLCNQRVPAVLQEQDFSHCIGRERINALDGNFRFRQRQAVVSDADNF